MRGGWGRGGGEGRPYFCDFAYMCKTNSDNHISVILHTCVKQTVTTIFL